MKLLRHITKALMLTLLLSNTATCMDKRIDNVVDINNPVENAEEENVQQEENLILIEQGESNIHNNTRSTRSKILSCTKSVVKVGTLATAWALWGLGMYYFLTPDTYTLCYYKNPTLFQNDRNVQCYHNVSQEVIDKISRFLNQ